MFERFTLRARQVLFHARAEVSRLGSTALEPEHIFLALIGEREALASRILARTGIPLADFRDDVLARVTVAPPIPESVEIPFSDACKRVLQFTFEEVDRLLHDHVGTEHLLLGLLREQRSVPADVLAARGVSIEAVRDAIVERRGSGPEPPGPPSVPANTYQWPQIPFAPSRTVHILYSGMRWPQPPVINHAGAVFSAYGFTLRDIVVRAWESNRWHLVLESGLDDDTRFDFLMVLPQPETSATCLGLLRSAIEANFAVKVTREPQMRDVFVLKDTKLRGSMLRRYPDREPGRAFASLSFSVFKSLDEHAQMFPLDAFAVHSVSFTLLVSWFEEILGGQIIDEARLPGVYGFELRQRVNTVDEFVALLTEEAGIVITRERRETSTLIVRLDPAKSP